MEKRNEWLDEVLMTFGNMLSPMCRLRAVCADNTQNSPMNHGQPSFRVLHQDEFGESSLLAAEG